MNCPLESVQLHTCHPPLGASHDKRPCVICRTASNDQPHGAQVANEHEEQTAVLRTYGQCVRQSCARAAARGSTGADGGDTSKGGSPLQDTRKSYKQIGDLRRVWACDVGSGIGNRGKTQRV